MAWVITSSRLIIQLFLLLQVRNVSPVRNLWKLFRNTGKQLFVIVQLKKIRCTWRKAMPLQDLRSVMRYFYLTKSLTDGVSKFWILGLFLKEASTQSDVLQLRFCIWALAESWSCCRSGLHEDTGSQGWSHNATPGVCSGHRESCPCAGGLERTRRLFCVPCRRCLRASEQFLSHR